MRFNLFGTRNNYMKTERENYVKGFKVDKELTITPCNKFVAVLEKLSRNYVLALKDPNHTETLQVANQNDVEFYEGYEFAPSYTDSVRMKLSKSAYSLYNIYLCMVEALNRLEQLVEVDKRTLVNDIKLDISATNNIILNIYQHLTMTFDVPQKEDCEVPRDIEGLLSYIKNLITRAINEIIGLMQNTIIEYILRQLEIIIDKLFNYFNEISNF